MVVRGEQRSGRPDDWQDLKGRRDEIRKTDNAEDAQHRKRHLFNGFNGHAVVGLMGMCFHFSDQQEHPVDVVFRLHSINFNSTPQTGENW